jgi:hypothetical protein
MEMEQHCGAAMHEERIGMQFLSEDGKEKRESGGWDAGSWIGARMERREGKENFWRRTCAGMDGRDGVGTSGRVSDAVGEKRHRFSMGTFSLVQFFHRPAFHLALSGEPSLTEENSLQFSPCS